MRKGDCHITVRKKIEMKIACMYINEGLVKKLCCICPLGYESELSVPVPQPPPGGMFLTLGVKK